MPWEFDRNHSLIGFTARHLGISTIHGQFMDADVTLDLDGDDPTEWSMAASIKTISLNSGVGRRDDHLRSEAYLNAEQYPTITFETRRIESRDTGYAVIGALTMHGVTQEIELAATFNGEAVDRELTKRGFSAQGAVDRFAFGVGEPKVTWTVGGEINLVLEMEAIRR
jgi:polyisoprenoid-binding protein YceI